MGAARQPNGSAILPGLWSLLSRPEGDAGSEDIERPHGYAGLIFWAWFILGTLALLWLNLARAAASYAPGWGGSGVLGALATAVARPGLVWAWATALVWRGLIGGQGIVWTLWYVSGRLLHRPLSPEAATWSYQVAYAFEHAIGAPPAYMGVAWNAVLFLFFVWALPLALTRRMTSTRDVDERVGTAHWPAPRKIQPYIEAVGKPGSLPLGTILHRRPGAGTRIALPLRDRAVNIGRFSHVAVWGVTEAGKTSGVFKPWLWTDLQMNDTQAVDTDGWPTGAMSSIVIDMKHPDIYEDIAAHVDPLPRRFLALAPGDLERSMHYNPLDFVRVDPDSPGAVDDIAVLADAIILNTPMGYRDDQFHQGRERDLLQLLIRYVCELQEARERGVPGTEETVAQLYDVIRPVLPPGIPLPPLRSFPMVAALVHVGGQRLLGIVQETITDPEHPDTWRARWEQFADKARRSDDFTDWLGGLRRRLAVFMTPGVAAISVDSDFSLDLVGRQPTTLIIGMPRVLTTQLESYSALILTQLLQQLKRVAAAHPSRRLPVPVTLYLDELPAQGQIPRLEHEIATLRDMAVSFVCGMQSTAALEARYDPKTVAAVTGNTNTKIVLGRNLLLEDMEHFSELAGETSMLAHARSRGERGSMHSVHPMRRALITPDQIRRMGQWEALVFLQTGFVTQTKLEPFHTLPRPAPTGKTSHLLLRGGYMDGGEYLPPVFWLRTRHRRLDATLGPWDTRPQALGPQGGLGHGATAAAAPAAPATAPASGAPAAGGASSTEAVQTLPQGTAPTGAGLPPLGPDEVTTHSQDGSAAGAAEAQDAATQAALSATAPEPGAVSDLAGFFNAIVRGKIRDPQMTGTDPPGWRIRMPGGQHVLVRWGLVRAFGDLRRTRARDIAERWQRAGFVVPRRLSLVGSSGPVAVLAFTPDALARLTPSVTDAIDAWPRIMPTLIQGLEPDAPRPAAPPPEDERPEPQGADGAASSGAQAPSPAPEAALRLVAEWARAHRRELEASSPGEVGQWLATVQGEEVLLVRQAHLNRLLFGRKVNLREVMAAWRSDGVIMAEEKRYTVHTRAGQKQQAGTRFVAFRWSRLKEIGLYPD